MDGKHIIRNMSSFLSRLQDEESEALFEMRFSYYLDRDITTFYHKLDNVLKSKERIYRSGLLENYYKTHPGSEQKKFVVFGAGEMGKLTIRSLQYLKKDIYAVFDNDTRKQGAEVNGVKVSGFSTSALESDVIFVIAVREEYQGQILKQLLDAGVPIESILYNHEGCIFCATGRQYFDLEPFNDRLQNRENIFVDAGAYDGMTTVHCAETVPLKKAYLFEIDKQNIAKIRTTLAGKKIEYDLINVGTWAEKGKVKIYQNPASYATKVSEKGGVEAPVDSIDNIVSNNEVNLIKLDVEGSELKTLYGAKKTVERYRPQMMISIYHKPEDIYQIPCFLESLKLDYKYYIRHYQTRLQETVLYCM